MPHSQQQRKPSDTAAWFTPECAHQDRVSDDVDWNMRHFALSEVGSNNWTFEEVPHDLDYGWLTKDTLGAAYLCGFVSCDEMTAIVDPKRLKVMAIRLSADYLNVEFEALSNKWKRETRHLSLISKQITHPAYLRIIGMGEAAIPLLLKELRDRPAHWFAALRATSNADPAGIDDSPSQAREAWLQWGISEGYID